MKVDAKRRVKKALYDYPKALKESVTSTVEWAESNFAIDYSKVCVQSSPGNHKETQLCNLMDKNLIKVRWCYVVEKVLDHYRFEDEKVKFIKEHFFKQKSDILTCLDVGISRRTFFRWQEEIIEVAYNWAKELKLIGD